jgi:hypothetical protein
MRGDSLIHYSDFASEVLSTWGRVGGGGGVVLS